MRKITMKLHYIIFLAIFSGSSSIIAGECVYVQKQTPDNPQPELAPQGECGQLINNDIFQLNDEHFKNLYFSENGLASIRYEDSIFYVSKSGQEIEMQYFDSVTRAKNWLKE